MKHGGLKSRLEVKIFGGGKIYEGSVDVGANNAAWVMRFLQQEGLDPVKADVGDLYPRKVYYFTESGRVLLKKLERVTNRTIADREQQYQETLATRKTEADVTLF
jgi:chemotaxis protein CheD